MSIHQTRPTTTAACTDKLPATAAGLPCEQCDRAPRADAMSSWRLPGRRNSGIVGARLTCSQVHLLASAPEQSRRTVGDPSHTGARTGGGAPMSMEMVAWNELYRHSVDHGERRPFSAATLRRIGRFARPHRARVLTFLVMSVIGAVLAVATPVLAGRVVDAIVRGGPLGVVVGLAVLIAGIAVVEAGVGVVQRWRSATLGEGPTLALRAAVFDNVQRQPVAFFTRTRTGALVSRLNNDVIGAQRAFSDTLSGVVGNVVTLALTLVVMLGLSWQVTVLALVLLPIFVLPAKRMGRRLAELNREAADHNAAMGTQMTERFSAPGATLVKLFGRPADETREFVARAARVRDIGVRTAMVQWVFVSALTLVSALALALVYGLGGWFALAGRMAPGDVVALALLITRLYAPLTGLAGARVEVMSALVSFGRVFEVLDLPPLIREPERPTPRSRGPGGRPPCPAGRCRWSCRTCGSPTRPPPLCRWRRSRTWRSWTTG